MNKQDFLIIQNSFFLKDLKVIGRATNRQQAEELLKHYKSQRQYVGQELLIFEIVRKEDK